MRELRKDLREREEAAVSQVLKRCDVIMSTLTTAGDGGPLRHLSEDHFDIVVIDECSQVNFSEFHGVFRKFCRDLAGQFLEG